MSTGLHFQVTDGKRTLGKVDFSLFLKKNGHMEQGPTVLNTSTGRIYFELEDDVELVAAIVMPVGEHWPMVFEAPFQVFTEMICPPLPTGGPIGWWHEAIGQTRYDPLAGRGIRIGVADTGMADHVALRHAQCIDVGNSTVDELRIDRSGHGTHVAGLIAARPTEPGRYCGVAPGARLFMAGVFDESEEASVRDVADAIEALSQDFQVDLINLSLGGPTRSEAVLDAVQAAFESGTLCIAAAGNDGGAVQYPALFKEVAAVSALGTRHWAPPGSSAAGHLPKDPACFGHGGFYLATFSARGPEIAATAPGVGLISCVPGPSEPSCRYAAMSGTSMAAPLVTGALACRLSVDTEYRNMPRHAAKAARALEILSETLRDLGLSRTLQGGGIPDVSKGRKDV